MSRPPKGRGGAARVRAAAGRSPASRRWLERQLNDPYVAEAKARGYRSRAAFKLIEMNAKHGLLRPGMRVVDLGAAPGGWTQVAAKAVGPAGRVVALDLLPMAAIPGAIVLQADFTAPETAEALRAALGGPADLVLSDMAPNTTGHAGTDHLRILALAEAALDFATAVLAPGGASRVQAVPGRCRSSAAGAAEARLRAGAACEAAGQPQGIARDLCGGAGVPRRRGRPDPARGCCAARPRRAGRIWPGAAVQHHGASFEGAHHHPHRFVEHHPDHRLQQGGRNSKSTKKSTSVPPGTAVKRQVLLR